MPTLTGLLFLLSGLQCLRKSDQYLFGLLILSALFQAASAINFGSTGIPPYYIVACLFIYSQVRRKHFNLARFRASGRYALFAFGWIGVMSALVYPFIFAGILVYAPHLGLDEGFSYQDPLHFSSSNLAQCAYLAINIFVVISAASMKSAEMVRSLYNANFVFLIGIIFLQYVCLLVGIEFPYSIFQNNPGAAMQSTTLGGDFQRLTGTFSESSAAGSALVLFYAGSLYEYILGRASLLPVAACSLAIILVKSSSGMLAAVIISIVILITYPPFHLGKSLILHRSRLLRLTWILVAASLIAFSPLIAGLEAFTTGKSETLSYVHRLAADAFSLRLTEETFGIGVGLGSNRPSSLLTSLLSNVGVLGTILFLSMCVLLAKNAKGTNLWIRWSLVAILLALCSGGPNINEPLLWLLLAMAVLPTSPSTITSLNSFQVPSPIPQTL